MNTGCEYPFTAGEFEALTGEERSAILAMAEYLTGSIVDPSDEDLSSALNLMKESEGCVPSEEVGADLLASVRQKFAAIYQTAIALAEVELNKRGFENRKHFKFCLVIDPSYEDSTHVLVVDYDKPISYLHEWSKAWHVGFENLATLAEAVLSTKAALVNKVQEIKNSEQTYSAPPLGSRSYPSQSKHGK